MANRTWWPSTRADVDALHAAAADDDRDAVNVALRGAAVEIDLDAIGILGAIATRYR